jgi:hypothetical protein
MNKQRTKRNLWGAMWNEIFLLQNRKNVFLVVDVKVLTFDLHFSTAKLGEQHTIADFHCNWLHSAILEHATLCKRQHDAAILHMRRISEWCGGTPSGRSTSEILALISKITQHIAEKHGELRIHCERVRMRYSDVDAQ